LWAYPSHFDSQHKEIVCSSPWESCNIHWGWAENWKLTTEEWNETVEIITQKTDEYDIWEGGSIKAISNCTL